MAAHHNQLSYLQQASDILQDKYKRLAARLGYTAKLIQLGHQVHVKGIDAPRLRRCKACHAPLGFDNIRHEERWLYIKCSLCGVQRKYSILNNMKLYKKRSKRRKRNKKKAGLQRDVEIIEVHLQEDQRKESHGQQQEQQQEQSPPRQSKRLKLLSEDDEVQVISSAPKPSPRRLRPSTKLVTRATQQCSRR